MPSELSLNWIKKEVAFSPHGHTLFKQALSPVQVSAISVIFWGIINYSVPRQVPRKQQLESCVPSLCLGHPMPAAHLNSFSASAWSLNSWIFLEWVHMLFTCTSTRIFGWRSWVRKKQPSIHFTWSSLLQLISYSNFKGTYRICFFSLFPFSAL